MSTTGLPVFDTTVQETNLWLKAVMDGLHTDDRHLAYLALRATLHALRDRLGPENAVHLAAQLPMLVRGLYYEGWRLAASPDQGADAGRLPRARAQRVAARLGDRSQRRSPCGVRRDVGEAGSRRGRQGDRPSAGGAQGALALGRIGRSSTVPVGHADLCARKRRASLGPAMAERSASSSRRMRSGSSRTANTRPAR